MYVPSYQMHNVLNAYSEQLRQNVDLTGQPGMSEQPPANQVNMTPMGKRRTTIERVSKAILDKIFRYGSLDATRQKLTDSGKGNTHQEPISVKENKTTFVFNAIDTINNKKTNTLSVEDSNFFVKGLGQSVYGVGDD